MASEPLYPELPDLSFVPFAEYLWSLNDEEQQRAAYLAKVATLNAYERHLLEDTLLIVARNRRSRMTDDPVKSLCIWQLVQSRELVTEGAKYGIHVVATQSAIKDLRSSTIPGASEIALRIPRASSSAQVFSSFQWGYQFQLGSVQVQITLCRPPS